MLTSGNAMELHLVFVIAEVARIPHAAGMMLANRYRDQDPTGLWLSEKLDGCRAFWDGQYLRTKDSWLPIHAPPTLTASLPKGRALDGELWAGRGTFEVVKVLVQQKRANHPNWANVRYMVFDAPTTASVPLERRWLDATQLAIGSRVQTVAQRICAGLADMQAEFARVLSLGGEGLVLRSPGHFYEFGRSRHWLKVKPALVD